MILKKIEVELVNGHITNCYILVDQKTKEAIIIDPGAEADKIIEMVKILDANVKYIILTHCHIDHIEAASEVKIKTDAKIIIHRFDEEVLSNGDTNRSENLGFKDFKLKADARIDDKDNLHVGDMSFEVIHSPGHTKGSICLYFKKDNFLFSGDTIFKGTYGRIDLPTGSMDDMINSINNKILQLPIDTIIYPGHGDTTILRDEKDMYKDF